MCECVCEGVCVCGFTSGSGKVPTCALEKASVSKGLGAGEKSGLNAYYYVALANEKRIPGSSPTKPGLAECCECVCVCGLAGDSRVPVRQACM